METRKRIRTDDADATRGSKKRALSSPSGDNHEASTYINGASNSTPSYDADEPKDGDSLEVGFLSSSPINCI